VCCSDGTLLWVGQVPVEDEASAGSLLEQVERDSSSDIDLLGFYPNFTRDRAMVSPSFPFSPSLKS